MVTRESVGRGAPMRPMPSPCRRVGKDLRSDGPRLAASLRACISHIYTPALRGAFLLSLSLSASVAFAQQSLPVIEVGPLSPAQPGSPAADVEDQTVVTPTRVEQPASSTGASVSVIHARDIQKRGSLGFNDVLRGVPGLDVYSNGGPGAQTSVALRGSTPGQTLVLIDGIRIGDPTSTDGSVDFGRLLPTDIERIEVLRGPQSALYGSDAMGGVINIITRRGKGAPQGWLMSEGGSYGTSSSRASISGADGQGSYALSISGLHADGFPRYGYRQQRPIVIGDQTTPLPPLPANDPTNNVGVTGRIGYDFTEDARIEAGIAGYDSAIRYDNPYAFNSWSVFDPFNHQHATFMQGYVRLGADMFDKTSAQQADALRQSRQSRRLVDGSLFRHADLPVAELPLRLSRRAQGRRISERYRAGAAGSRDHRFARRNRDGAEFARGLDRR